MQDLSTDGVSAVVLALYRSRKLVDHRAGQRVLHRVLQDGLGCPPSRAAALETVTDPDLPRLAWCCEVGADGEHRFVVGPGVEVRDEFVFEGVWDGPFEAGGADRTDLVFGSGARVRGGDVVFVPPKHCWEGLFVLVDRKEKRALVSNSMIFALVSGGVDLAGSFFREVATHLRHRTDQATAVGFERYDPLLAEDGRYRLYRLMFTNFTLDAMGAIRLRPTRSTIPFRGFDEYRRFLLAALSRLAENGAAPLRRAPLRPITPISSGYDSTAVGVLAAELGFSEAVTIDVTIAGKRDSGEGVGRRLGLNVHTVGHVHGQQKLKRLARVFEGEAANQVGEFVATAGLGDDVNLLPLEPHLAGGIMLSGAMGDSAWRRRLRLAPGLPVGIPYGKSFTEFRLRVGYAFVPVPALGARFPEPLRRVTRSDGMAPYTLDGPYDRPIARRLAEEAGIDRRGFARAKTATNPTVLNHKDLFRPSVARIAQRYASARR